MELILAFIAGVVAGLAGWHFWPKKKAGPSVTIKGGGPVNTDPPP